MSKPALAILIAAAVLLTPGLPAPAQEASAPELPFTEGERQILNQALRFERELVRIVKKVRPASVTIENWRKGRGGVLGKAGGGSGVLISSKGYILTNQHVVQGAVQVWVVVEDHRRFLAKVVGADIRGDVALLKIEGRGLKYKDPRRANPARLSAGEWVIATGNPFLLAGDGEAVVTLGVVSGLERVVPGQFFYGDAIQHDAKINPGNSGGPLWDTNGNLLGINGKIAMNSAGGVGGPSSSGVGYTIPINQIRNFLEDMYAGRKVQHGDELLGVTAATHKDEDGTVDGVEVKKVRAGSPANLARAGGVRVGDVIVRIMISGRPREVRTLTRFIAVLSPLAEGSKIALTVRRGRKRLVIPNIVLKPPVKKQKGKR